jgi:hypothetical protein
MEESQRHIQNTSEKDSGYCQSLAGSEAKLVDEGHGGNENEHVFSQRNKARDHSRQRRSSNAIRKIKYRYRLRAGVTSHKRRSHDANICHAGEGNTGVANISDPFLYTKDFDIDYQNRHFGRPQSKCDDDRNDNSDLRYNDT